MSCSPVGVCYRPNTSWTPGYPSTTNLLACRTEYQVSLIAPMRGDSCHPARTHNGFTQAAFTIDFDHQQATCPQGHHSGSWHPTRQNGHDAIVVRFPTSTCSICPARTVLSDALPDDRVELPRSFRTGDLI
ncbi:hypothetical protein DMB66_61090 [Actinoplanes sp. ATCC 53533]|uniref:hypothetical protein n=1 Tax=Actinoplanes sp. ATCC 53533 TaxID=1288362 RepID=UPI001002A4D8|nr:hypothetical protein [Actinoplanes sp. ATCC 53533]RSM34517.1 hypothetical protein DMB66_61090 [Actinoplanes sp. ATCC 53533]